MRKLIGNLKPYWHWIIVLALVLCVQAFADLALPEYTQDIIDTGIQNKGIEHIIPEKMTEKDYQSAQLFMEKSEREEWESIYKKEGDTYQRKELSQEKLDELDQELLTPLVLTYQVQHASQEDMAKFSRKAKETGSAGSSMSAAEGQEQLALLMSGQGQLPEEVIKAAKAEMQKTIDAVGDKTLKAMGIAYAAEADKNAGMDVDQIQKSYLWYAGGKMFLMALLFFLAASAAAFIAAKVGARVGRDLRSKQFRNVMAYSDAEISKFSTASLITRSTNDVQQIQMTTTMMLRMAMYAPVLGIWGIVKVAQTGANMGYIVALAVLLIMAFVGCLMAVTMPKFRIMQELIDGVNQVAREILTGLSVIRAFTREKEEEGRFEVANQKLKRTQLFTNRVMSLMQPTMQLVMFGLIAIITWVAAHRIDEGVLQVGAMTAFITYSMLIVMSFLIITVMSILLPRAGVAAERIDEVVRTHSSIEEVKDPKHIQDHRGVVAFENVSFGYPDAEENVIEGIDFTAEAGKTTALIGSTGSGKSSVVNLIPRFYDVTGGRITLDGVDIRELSLKELRSSIGFVPQKGTLFSGTIDSNIRFGAPDATEEDVKLAAEIAQAAEFVNEKEDGYESAISQGGSNVSGGQKQRLAIARAIAKKPEVLVFDDSFSALDMKTDAKVRDELAHKVAGVTKIIVAQRVSTILHADQILVMDEGRVVGKGTHAELMKSCQVYQEIANSQMSAKELEALS